jgi:polyhydroxybutyrate depolymerase
MSRSLLLGSFVVVLAASCKSDPKPSPLAQAAHAPTNAPEDAAPSDPPVVDAGRDAADANDAEPPWVWVAPNVPVSSPACGVVDATSGDALDFNTPKGRAYHVWGPTNYDKTTKYSVVVVFHGWFADGKSFEKWFEMEKYVDRSETFVVYPDALNGQWDQAGTTDLDFYDDMMKDLGARFCIDPSRVLGFGFSYGGKFANHLGCKRAGWVKAIAIGDGSPGGDWQKCGRIPVLFTHRTKDSDELIAWGRQAAALWQGVDQCSATTEVSNAAMNCVSNTGCKAPGSLTFCEDTFYDPTWPADWNHTVREPYRALTYQWFRSLP